MRKPRVFSLRAEVVGEVGLVGIAVSAAFFTTRPNYYRSTARLVVESDRPTVLDANSGEVVSGVPPADLLLMQ